WGIYEPVVNWGSYVNIEHYEEAFGYRFPIVMNYSDVATDPGHRHLRWRLDNAWARGKVLELTFQTNHTKGEGNMVYSILNGEYDEFLIGYARIVADFGHPVLFRPFNEMNGDWCPYSAYHTSKDTEIYKALYRYVYQLFLEAEADNVIWVWNPNGKSYPGFKWNDELMYYPGDQYVDVVGLTAYNTGTFYNRYGEKWRTFKELYDELYTRYDLLFGQPLMITEFASASMGGDKEEWVESMFADIRLYDRIKIAVWWDACDYDAYGYVSRSYIMDESPGLMEIFAHHLSGRADE
ncbi:MAG: glycoside hydrolase family 26 protein, partial [Clostridiales bacterium]|nr:glycoside hydrolase family 26 protein [Clostridiales bacterium]